VEMFLYRSITSSARRSCLDTTMSNGSSNVALPVVGEPVAGLRNKGLNGAVAGAFAACCVACSCSCSCSQRRWSASFSSSCWIRWRRASLVVSGAARCLTLRSLSTLITSGSGGGTKDEGSTLRIPLAIVVPNVWFSSSKPIVRLV
jgi:hypothetical protein